MKDWITNADRVKGNSSVIVNEYTPEDDNKEDDKTPEKVVNGYYVVIFDSVNDNKVPTVDVHHLLKAFKDDENVLKWHEEMQKGW